MSPGHADLVAQWAQKAPVCMCRDPHPCVEGGPMCGPQRKALKLRRQMEQAGISLPTTVTVGLSHAHYGEGRGEFDAAVNAWISTAPVSPHTRT